MNQLDAGIEDHEHQWRSRVNSPYHHIVNFNGMWCECGATLPQGQVEEYVNRWQDKINKAKRLKRLVDNNTMDKISRELVLKYISSIL